MAFAFQTPEKPVPAEFYEKLTWAPKADKFKPRALFQSGGDQTPTSSLIHPQKLNFDDDEEIYMDCEFEKAEPQIPPSPPRNPLPLKFYEQLLQAPKRPTVSSVNKCHGRYSLPATSNVSHKSFHNRSCITFST